MWSRRGGGHRETSCEDPEETHGYSQVKSLDSECVLQAQLVGAVGHQTWGRREGQESRVTGFALSYWRKRAGKKRLGGGWGQVWPGRVELHMSGLLTSLQRGRPNS